jgi:hypothetical protein
LCPKPRGNWFKKLDRELARGSSYAADDPKMPASSTCLAVNMANTVIKVEQNFQSMQVRMWKESLKEEKEPKRWGSSYTNLSPDSIMDHVKLVIWQTIGLTASIPRMT